MNPPIDMLGNPLYVGNPVIYAKSSQGDDGLYEGTIEAIKPNGYLSIRRKDTNRVSSKGKRPSDVINVKPLQDALPECFI